MVVKMPFLPLLTNPANFVKISLEPLEYSYEVAYELVYYMK